jgi:hypothetical protein
LGEFVRANREKKQPDWLATNTDDITNQSQSQKKNRQVDFEVGTGNKLILTM